MFPCQSNFTRSPKASLRGASGLKSDDLILL